MGCFSSRRLSKKNTVRGFSESLPILNENMRLTEEVVMLFKRGMTLNPRVKASTLGSQQADYLRPENDIDCLTAEIQVRDKSEQEFESIKLSLLNHFLFRDLSDEPLRKMINSMNYCILNENQFIFQQGDSGYNFFIIASGSVELSVDSRRLKVLGKGDSFGELALLHDSSRRASAKTITKVRLWGLGRGTFKMILKKANSRKFKENLAFISSTEILSALSKLQLESLVLSAVTETFEENEKIISAGEIAAEMYIIKEGEVNIFKNSIKVNTLRKGDYFGEHSLIYGTTRIASAIATCHTVCLCYTQDALKKVLGLKPEKYLYHNAVRISLSNDNFLNKLTPLQINKLVPYVNIKEITGNLEFSLEKTLVIVIKGSVVDRKTQKVWKNLKCVESNLLVGEEKGRIDSFFAEEEATIALIEKEHIIKAFGISIEKRLECNEILKMMQKIHLLRYVPADKVETLSLMVKSDMVAADKVLFNEGDDGDFCYLIKEGKVSIIKDGKSINTIEKGAYLGERAIIFSEKRAATARTIEDSEFWLIYREDFLQLLDKDLEIYLQKKILLQDMTVKLSDIEILEEIDKNPLSNMHLVCSKHNGMIYALKSVEKSVADIAKLEENLKNDKIIHKKVCFPFISTLVKSFTDAKYYYLLYEYISGPSLETLIAENTCFSMKNARFYSSIILLTLEYLHNENIINRAINSQSFYIDEGGYPVLTSFINSKIIESRTYSIVGFPHYMAPEIINGSGYSFSSDLWSLGILIYEMLYGVYPFGNTDQDPYKIYEKIAKGNVKYPVFIKESMKPKGIIEFLLQKDPLLRGSAEDLKAHVWFEGLPWEDLLARHVKPDFIPEMRNIDISKSTNLKETLDTEGDEIIVDSSYN